MSIPFASAGTREKPEVTDPPGDASPNLPQYDILKAWLNLETIDSFNVNVELADLNNGESQILGIASYQVDYQVALMNKQNLFYIVDFQIPVNITVLTYNETLKIHFPIVCWFGVFSEDGISAGDTISINGSINIANKTISATVPKKLLTDYQSKSKKYDAMLYSVLSEICLCGQQHSFPENTGGNVSGIQTLQISDVAFGDENASKYHFQVWPEMDGNSTNESNNATIQNKTVEPEKQKIIPGFEFVAVICVVCAALCSKRKFRI
jgi:hypothetical protein